MKSIQEAAIMPRTHSIVQLLLLLVLLPFLLKCSKIEVETPSGPSDSSAIILPVFRISLDSSGTGSFPLDSILNKYPDFSIRFDPISVGTFKIDLPAKKVVFEKTRNDWTIDSTQCEVCVNEACKKSKIVVRNYRFVQSNTCDTLPDIGPISVSLLGQVPVTVWPRKSWGKVTEIRPGFYSANVIASDSNRILFRAVGNPKYYGFDEVGFTVTDSLGKCHVGKILFAIGDPCEASANNDSIALTGLVGKWPVSQFLANDTSCGGPVEDLQFRLSSNTDYGTHLSIVGPVGVLTDTVINSVQTFQYKKGNTSALKDEFLYYVYDPNTLKITRARIRIKFQ